MTAQVLKNLTTLPDYTKSFRDFLARLARAIDALVSARAARAVPEWQMRKVQSEIDRYQNIIRASDLGPDSQVDD